MTILDEFRRDEQRVLDRLVDGELSADERRALLAWLDDEPGAWRRCALAFVEAQSWRWQLSRLAAEPLVCKTSADVLAATQKRRRRFWELSLAVAAGLLVAFGLGTWFTSTQSAPTAEVVTPAPARIELATETEPEPAAPAAEESPKWETLTLAATDGVDPADQFQLRVLDSNESDEGWSLDEQSELPASLQSLLEASGLQVERQRRLLPIDLSDGRRMVVPVEEINIRNPDLVVY
jgi:hypothetical protein